MIDMKLRNSCAKVTLNPFRYVTYSMGTSATVVIVLLLLQAAMLLVTKSYDALIVLAVATVASFLSEAVAYLLKPERCEIHTWRISIMQGLLLGLLVPSTYHPLAVFSIAFFTMLIGKISFGGFAESWVNMVVVSVIVMYLANATAFPSLTMLNFDLQSRNSALSLIQSGALQPKAFDSAVTSALNSSLFKFIGISIPNGYVTLLWDTGSTIPAFRFNLLTLASSIVLFSLDMLDALIPSCFLVVYSLLIRCLAPAFLGSQPFHGDIILALTTGGTLFGTFHMLQWYGTVPVSNVWRAIYGILAGFIGFFIIGFGTSAVGFAFFVLTMNLVSTLLQTAEDKRLFRRIALIMSAKPDDKAKGGN